MSYETNQSVVQFKRDMQDLLKQMAQSVDETSALVADELVSNMKEAAPKRTGTLAASIRKIRLEENIGDIKRVTYLIVGGGKTTTKRTHTGHSYDYAVGTEFGTHKERAEPFFYNTSRRYFNAASDQFSESVDKAIEENNAIRAVRQENSEWGADTDFNVQREARGRAVSIPGKQI